MTQDKISRSAVGIWTGVDGYDLSDGEIFLFLKKMGSVHGDGTKNYPKKLCLLKRILENLHGNTMDAAASYLGQPKGRGVAG
jgi:hypothetical protein